MIAARRPRATTTALLVITVATIAMALVLVTWGRSSDHDRATHTAASAGPEARNGDPMGSTGDDTSNDDRASTDDPRSSLDQGSADEGDGSGDTGARRGTALVDAVCSGDVAVEDLGTLGSEDIDEASGLAASHANPGVWWTHNDSGGRPELYALDERGALLAVVRVGGVTAHDWEDIASVVDAAGHETVYIGDIGDRIMGGADRDHVTVQAITAPVIDTATTDREHAPVVLDVDPTTTHLVYPDGPRDAEALIVDTYDDALYLIDKDWTMKGASTLYRVPLAELTGATTERARDSSDRRGDDRARDSSRGASGAQPRTATLERVAELDLPALTLITAADASADGSAVALRGYGFEALYHRSPGQSIIDALSGEHCVGPLLDELQGEALGFSADSGSYVTLAEGRGAMLHRVTATGSG